MFHHPSRVLYDDIQYSIYANPKKSYLGFEDENIPLIVDNERSTSLSRRGKVLVNIESKDRGTILLVLPLIDLLVPISGSVTA